MGWSGSVGGGWGRGRVGGMGVWVEWKLGEGLGRGVLGVCGRELESLRSYLRIQNQGFSHFLWFLPQLLCEGRTSKRNANVLVPSGLGHFISQENELKNFFKTNLVGECL